MIAARERRRGVLLALARSPALRGGDWEGALRETLDALRTGLQLASVSYWASVDDGAALQLEAWQPQDGAPVASLLAAACPAYFAALDGGDALFAEDAREAAYLREFAAAPACACLDMPCRLDDALAGVLHGEADAPRAWNEDERVFSQGVVALLEMGLANARHRAAGEQARLAQLRYQQLLELFPDGVLLQGQDGVRYINPAGLRLLGLTEPAQVLGVDMKSFVLPGQQELLRERMQRMVRDGGVLPPVVLKMRRADGAVIDVEARSVRLPQGDSGLMQTIYRDVTERNAFEAGLRESEAQFRSLFELSPHAVMIQDLDAIRQINPAGVRLLGAADASEIIGRPSTTFVEAADVAMVRRRIATLQAGDVVAPQEFECRRLDGQVLPVLVSSVAIAGGPASGGRVLVQTIILDLSERRAAEAALKAGEARYRNLIEMSPHAVLLQDLAGIRFINPAGVRLFGANDAAQIVGRPMLEFVPARFHAELQARATRPLPLGTALPPSEQEIARLDGSVIPVEVISVTIEEPSRPGGLKLAQTIMRDLSERRAVEDGLRRFNQQLEAEVHRRTAELRRALSMQHAILEATADAILVLSREGRAAHFNRKLLELWDVTEAEVWAADSAGLLGLARERIAQSRGKLFEDDTVLGAGSESREVLRLKNGRYIETSAAPQVLDGKLVGRVWSSRDITERVLAEQATRELNASLEERVRQRTGELAGVNRELEAFSYSISHDLRAPVRAVSGFAGILKFEHGQALGPDGIALIERIQAAGERMNAMIEGLLALARLGDREVRRLEVDLSSIARTVWQEAESIEPGRGIEFVLAPGLRAVGDAVLLSTLLQNLIDNARKYSRGCTGTRIEVGRRETARGMAYFVADNGAGFDMAHADKLFQLFSRLHSAGEFEGTGIGLATAQRIVHRHGGEIWAESTPGVGSTFYFMLP